MVRAASRLAGDEVEEVCASLRQWRDRGERELPWLAGPGLSALGRVAATPAGGPDLQKLERFLIGAETDPQRVSIALAILEQREDRQLPTVPADARGALADAAARFFDLLGLTYAACHRTVREGHRRRLDDLVAQWQPRLDAAAAQIDQHALALTDRPAHVPVKPPAPAKRKPDRLYLAVAFALLALIGACSVLWLVLQGWPMQPVDLPF